jgi:superfamily II DNA or RNA helicase
MNGTNYLSKYGYVILKESLSQDDLKLLKRDLIAKPLVDDKFGKAGDLNYPCYIETKNKLYIPKNYGIKKYGFPKLSLNYIGKSWEHTIEFKGELFPNQIEPVNKLIDACHHNGGGILSLATGAGKTISAIYTLSQLKMKTLIVVNKITLMKQWENEINQFMPDASIGILQGQKKINTDCDIVISMLQSLSRVDYPDSLFNDFGTVIIDECFPYNTEILTNQYDVSSPIKIGYLYDMYTNYEKLPQVKTFNEKTREFEWKNIKQVFRKKNNQLIGIQCNNGHIFYSTYEHLYLTTNGWKKAINLKINDILIGYNSSPTQLYNKNTVNTVNTVTTIFLNVENECFNNYVYDLEVQDNHNYIICYKETDNVLNIQDTYRGVVVHNCHNTSSQVFSKIFFKICSKYTIGLSATPQRSDGCENVFQWHLGDIVYQSPVESEREGLSLIVKTLTLNSNDYKEVKVTNKYTDEEQIQYTSMLSELLSVPNRNNLIIQIIKHYIAIENRRILLLSDRRTHVQELKKILDSDLSVTFTYGLFIGGMKPIDLEKNKSAQCILATYKAFSEGVSEKDLNTLLLVSPKKFISNSKTNTKKDSGQMNQISGRIFRKIHHDIHPLIIDLQDNFSVFKHQNKQRNTFYKKTFPNAIFKSQTIHLNHMNNLVLSSDTINIQELQSETNQYTSYTTCLID